MSYDTLIKGGLVVIPGQGIREADLGISGERIAAILERGAQVEAKNTIDATGLHVLPAALDTLLIGDIEAILASSVSRTAGLPLSVV